MDDQKAIERGKQAAMIINHELVREVFDSLEKACWEEWKGSASISTESREHIYRLMWAGNQFKRAFENILREGEIAAKVAASSEKTRSYQELLKASANG